MPLENTSVGFVDDRGVTYHNCFQCIGKWSGCHCWSKRYMYNLPGLRYRTCAGDAKSRHSACYIGYIYSIQDMLLVLLHSCADSWSTKTSNLILCLDISQMFHISVKHWLYIYLYLLAITCDIIIDYHVNTDTPFVCSSIQVFIPLQYCS